MLTMARAVPGQIWGPRTQSMSLCGWQRPDGLRCHLLPPGAALGRSKNWEPESGLEPRYSSWRWGTLNQGLNQEARCPLRWVFRWLTFFKIWFSESETPDAQNSETQPRSSLWVAGAQLLDPECALAGSCNQELRQSLNLQYHTWYPSGGFTCGALKVVIDVMRLNLLFLFVFLSSFCSFLFLPFVS